MRINTARRVEPGNRASKWVDRAQFAGLASAGAGACHLAAAGMHAADPSLARIFVILGAAQLITGLVFALEGGRLAAAVVAVVNIVAVSGWTLTRTVGISWVQGLTYAEGPQFTDTVCATLGTIALVLAAAVLLSGPRRAPRVGLVLPGVLVGAVSLAAMLTGATYAHGHGETGHAHAGDPSVWPRPFDPNQPIDLSGVPGVSPEQQGRAEMLVARTLRDLPQFADVTKIGDLGFSSIGDAASGYEHYVNSLFLRDDGFLDPNRPESLVYRVDGDERTLVAAMFATTEVSLTDPDIVDWGGPLMQWHVHKDLCWSLTQVVVGVTDEAGNCAPGSINAGRDAPMVHVWIAPNECGPFAALEGRSAGQVAGNGPRFDQCAAHDHGG